MSAKILVTQTMLRKYARLEARATEARDTLQAIDAALIVQEFEIIELLKEGSKVERGVYNALLNHEEGARRPAWKELYLEHMTALHGDNRTVVEAEVVRNCKPKTKQVLIVTGPAPKV